MQVGRWTGRIAAAAAAALIGCGDSGEGSTSEGESDATTNASATDPSGDATTAGMTAGTTGDGETGTSTSTTMGPTSDPSAGTTSPLTTGAGCEPPLEDCGGGCVDVDFDPENCGGCGNDCTAQGMICVLGSCEVMCADPEVLCDGACVNPETDPQHCGGCGIACDNGQVCNAGACALDCDPGLTACDDACVDLQSDPNFCGACDVACVGQEQCVDGQCELQCMPGEQVCDNACVDPQLDVNHCGDCGVQCPAPPNGVAECTAGACGVQCDDGYLPDDQNMSCTNCSAAAVLLDGPIAYWRLGELQGMMTAVDEIGGSDGTYLDVTLGAPGVSGDGDTAATLGGMNLSRVNVPTFDIMPADALSIELWVNSAVAGQGTPFSYAVNAQNNEVLVYDVNDLQVYIRGTATGPTGLDVADGAWHHVVVTWQSVDGDTQIYVDGAPVYATTLQTGQTVTPGGHLALGHEQDGVNSGYDPAQRLIGDLDEVALYDFVLTPAQVAGHYEAVQGNMCE
ncbi:MAG: hypothetical protein KC468_05090 [Myxococcales bacterium]|nr:hypothetical protein [Myxococcales bacterium]